MTRTLRGAWSRRGTLLPLLVLTVVVVGGAVAVVDLARRTGTSPALALPLLLLGAVAVPATGRELAAARRGEIAISRLRGLQGGELAALLAVEPLLVLLTGGLAGLLLGSLGAVGAARAWGGSTGPLPGGEAVLAGCAIVLAGLVAVLAGMSGALREPLSEQVSLAARPRTSSVAAVFVDVLVVVGAVVAVYRGAVAGEDPDWVVLAGPALVGLAVGQVVVWLVRVAARLAVRRTASGRLAGFLAVRRLARAADAAASLRVLVAAAVVAALALTGAAQVDDWADDTARLRTAAPLSVVLEDEDAVGALALTHRLDPEGRWLMAAVLVPGRGTVAARRAFLDLPRYDAVAREFLAGTAASGVAARVDELAGGTAAVATGDRARVTVRGVSPRRDGRMRPLVVLDYVDDQGTGRELELGVEVARDGGPRQAQGRLRGCTGGCVLTLVTLRRTPGDTTLPFLLTDVDFGGVDALAEGWQPLLPARDGRPGGPVTVDEGLLAPAAAVPLAAEPVSGGARTPLLATTSVVWPDGPPLLDSPGGDERPARVLARLPALPLVEADGVLADLGTATAGAPPTVPAAEVRVLARADSPPALLAELADRAGARPRTLAQADAAVVVESGAAQARAYTLMGLLCVAVALLVVAAAVARQRAAWRREVAALRTVHLPLPELRRSGRLEIGWLAVAAVLATVVGTVAAVRLLLANLALVDVPLHAVPLRAGLTAWPLLVAALLAGAVVVGVLGRGRVAGGERSRPATLREESAR